MSVASRALHGNQVHVWQFRLDQPDHNQSRVSILSPDEQTRADQLKIPATQARFIAARATLRLILSEYTGIPPSELQFRYNSDGKPELDQTARDIPLYFNLTHSGDNALLALALQPVGIDLEQIRPLTGLEYIMNTAFTVDERQLIAAFSEDRKIFTFFRFWVCKEAVMKALGGGFKLAAQITIQLSDQGVPVLHLLPDDELSTWTLTEIPSPAGTLAALAVHQSQISLGLFNRD